MDLYKILKLSIPADVPRIIGVLNEGDLKRRTECVPDRCTRRRIPDTAETGMPETGVPDGVGGYAEDGGNGCPNRCAGRCGLV